MQMSENMVSTDPSNPNAMAGLMCTAEGKAAFSCIMQYLQECPELKQMMSPPSGDGESGMGSGMDFTSLFQGETVEIYCELFSGECGKVMECFQGNAMEMDGSSMMRKRSLPNQNVYVKFQYEAYTYCSEGPIKESATCLKERLKHCSSDLIPRIEKMLEGLFNGSDGQGLGVTTDIDKMITFVTEKCKDIPANLHTKTCLADNQVGECSNNITAKFPQLNQCGVLSMSQRCISTYVEPACGKEVADFYRDNQEFIFSGIPAQCMTSGVSTVMATLGMIFSALLITVFL